MAVCTADFERGVNGATVATTDAGSATAFDATDITANGLARYSNAHAYGSLSGEFGATGIGGGRGAIQWNTGTLTDHYGRVYLYLTSYDASQMPFIFGGQTFTRGFRIDLNTSGQLAGFDNPAAALFPTFSTPVPPNQWVRIEYHIVQSATVGSAEVKMFSSPDSTTPTETQSGTNKNTLANIDTMQFGAGIGSSVNTGYTIWLDNIVAGADSYPGPAALPDPSQQATTLHGVGMGKW